MAERPAVAVGPAAPSTVASVAGLAFEAASVSVALPVLVAPALPRGPCAQQRSPRLTAHAPAPMLVLTPAAAASAPATSGPVCSSKRRGACSARQAKARGVAIALRLPRSFAFG